MTRIEDKIEIEDLTGCIPLLLQDLLSGQYKGQTYIDVRDNYLASSELVNVRDWTVNFAAKVKRKLTESEFIE